MSHMLRCAIYTRKSSEEGLDQAFNSLDAQREACAAYIESQRHEGWTLLPARYDDGGFSGGNLERPAMQRLLADIAEGTLDLIVVYKVDRLTRSLSDFAKLVERLDAKNVSFVSVTQAFNTTTSMGRLTLNVLLSFAQFEREVTGERIRDKIAASKKKGMWMGGMVPLGYDVVDRKLVVNEAEAEQVRTIYRRYLELGGVAKLADALKAGGFRTRVRTAKGGNDLRRVLTEQRCALQDPDEPNLSRRGSASGYAISGTARRDRSGRPLECGSSTQGEHAPGRVDAAEGSAEESSARIADR